jgi:hypothetical protein
MYAFWSRYVTRAQLLTIDLGCQQAADQVIRWFASTLFDQRIQELRQLVLRDELRDGWILCFFDEER